MCQCLVLVLSWFSLLCQCPLSAAVRIPCSQLAIAILAAVRRNSQDKGLSGEMRDNTCVSRDSNSSSRPFVERPHAHYIWLVCHFVFCLVRLRCFEAPNGSCRSYI